MKKDIFLLTIFSSLFFSQISSSDYFNLSFEASGLSSDWIKNKISAQFTSKNILIGSALAILFIAYKINKSGICLDSSCQLPHNHFDNRTCWDCPYYNRKPSRTDWCSNWFHFHPAHDTNAK